MQIAEINHAPEEFRFEEVFAQHLQGQGAIFYRNGTLKTRLSVEAFGRWDGRVLTLDEYLTYESGELHHRTFYITKIDDNNYIAECDEFEERSSITRHHSGFRWQYRLTEDSKEAHRITLSANDQLYLCADGSIIDHAILSKYGVRVGDVFMMIRPMGK
jgi:hypothetical protein